MTGANQVSDKNVTEQDVYVPFYHRMLFWFPVGILVGALLCVALLPYVKGVLLEREAHNRLAEIQQKLDLQTATNEALEQEIARLNELLAGDPCEAQNTAPGLLPK